MVQMAGADKGQALTPLRDARHVQKGDVCGVADFLRQVVQTMETCITLRLSSRSYSRSDEKNKF